MGGVDLPDCDGRFLSIETDIVEESDINQYKDHSGNVIINNSDAKISNLVFYGKNNTVTIGRNVKIGSSVRIELHGGASLNIGEWTIIGDDTALIAYDESLVSIGDYTTIGQRCNISARYDSIVRIGHECIVRDDAYIFNKYASEISIGDRSTFEKRTIMIAVSNSRISIGNGFMGSFDVSSIDNDGHALYNKHTGNRYNQDSSITVGDDVWVGLKSSILSGANIPNGVVVGAGSVVTRKSFMKSDSAVVGNPAKTVKEDIRWQRYI